MKFKKLLLILTLFVISANSAFATQLPTPIKNFILSENPQATIRFDSLIILKDGTIYLPIFPSYLEKVHKLEVTYTYPNKANFKDKPEVIIFNTNFALLKLITTKNGVLTVCQNPDIPMVVKTGSLPQDILVPRGLVFPDILKGILGDVQVPLLNATNIVKTDAPKKQNLIVQNVKNNNISEKVAINYRLKNKNYYVSNYNSQLLKVFSSDSPEPIYSLKLSGVLKDMQSVCGGKYLIILTNSQKQIDVIDVRNEYISKQIDLSVLPSEIVVDAQNDKAYVASFSDKSIFVIDLKEMKVKEKINVIGSPQKITISTDGTQLGYIDRDTSNIYILKLDGSYENKLIANIPNLSKMIINDGSLYSINRTEQVFKVTEFDLDKFIPNETDNTEEFKNNDMTLSAVLDGIASGFKNPIPKEKTLNTGPKYFSTNENIYKIGIKPTDMILYKNKIYILCSQSNDVEIFDTKDYKITKVINIPISGFSRKITPVDNSNIAIITNVLEKKYVVMDLDKEEIIQTVNIDMPVNAITVVDKK